ncbi:MAG: mechanosensitive ion channel, partial [Oscillospiraceae bacterium]|nr:mechanosensitive ion channel [Oscillospiraceae bacterium]
LESNENAVLDVYEQMQESRKNLKTKYNGEENQNAKENTENIIRSLSWMERITNLKVGRDGQVVVVSKQDSTILAHSNSHLVGLQAYISTKTESEKKNSLLPEDDIADVAIEDITSDVKFNYHFLIPEITRLYGLKNAMICYVASYEDTYIICGITLKEFFSMNATGLFISLIVLILMWIFVKYVCLHLESRLEEKKTLQPKLFAYSVIITVMVFAVSLYAQVLSDMINDLKTMEKHAQVAVETLDTYQEIREDINEWLDEQYLIQCQFAADYISHIKKESLTREDMKNLAELLHVKHVYLFDKNGKTIVTNSPYDHFKLSNDETAQSYAFRPLLDGAEYVIQEPMENDAFGEYMQYIGVSIRNEKDLCDGFVQIGIDPALRDKLIAPFYVETVLNNLVIGLPEHALAIDKETLTVAATTGIGFKDEPVEKLGINIENLTEHYSGFLWINGKEYYAGFSESSDMYLVPIVLHKSNWSVLYNSCLVAVVAFLGLLAVLFIAFRRYEPLLEQPQEKKPESFSESEEDRFGMFSGFSNLIKTQEKFLFEERWNLKPSSNNQTPEKKMNRIIYWILILFSIINLLPAGLSLLFETDEELDGLSYVVMGHWEKGVNLFSVSSCIFLLFGLHLFGAITDQILYHIAKISDARVETICLLLRSAMKYVRAVIFIYFGLSQFGIPSQTLLASAGILSLIIGLGAKDLVNDIIAGFFIIFEGTFKVGDFITIGNWYGTVTQIGIRTTKVTFFSETKIYYNSSIREIINSDGAVSRTKLKIPVSYDIDLREIKEIFSKELPLLTEKIPGLLKTPRYDGVTEYESSCMLLRISIYTVPYLRGKARRAMLTEL